MRGLLLILNLLLKGAVAYTPDAVPKNLDRRRALQSMVAIGSSTLLPRESSAEEESMFAPKFVQQYDDFIQKNGWSYRDVTPGTANSPKAETGDRVVFDWR